MRRVPGQYTFMWTCWFIGALVLFLNAMGVL